MDRKQIAARLIKIAFDTYRDQAGQLTNDPQRVRRIRHLAASMAKKRLGETNVHSWLLNDEKGTWDKDIDRYLHETQEKAERLHMTEQKVDEEIAGHVLLLAMQAALAEMKKRKGK